eukprot:gene11886-13118_t
MASNSWKRTSTPERYLVFFQENTAKELESYVAKCFEMHGLLVEEEECPDHSVLTVAAPFEMLLEEAANIELEKKLKGEGNKYQEVYVDGFDKFEGSDDTDTFFTHAEQSLLLHNCLNKVEFEHEKLRKLGIRKFREHESLITGGLHSTPQIFESITPLHSSTERRSLWKEVKKNPFIFPLDHLQSYYGEEIAFYFAWMNFFTLSLIFPALFGIFLFFHRPKGITVDDSPYLPAYAFLMALWTIYFCKSWRRQESELALRWNATLVEKKEIVRPEYYGELRQSPITGKSERHYPTWKRLVMYLLSFLLTLPFLALAVGAMILSLNFNGYVKDKHSPIYLATLARFSEPGHLFAGDSPYYGWMVPTITHSVVINILNRIYRNVATFCTDFENHRTEQQYNSSLIIKKVLFELFDCYLPLFYIAFYQLNIISLRRELIGLFWGDEIRRLVTESIIPLLTEKLKHYRMREHIEKIKQKTGERPHSLQVVEDALLEEYEQFDDYLEMTVQFGYVTLFASAFPLCSVITIAFLFLEARSDVFKLLFICRRPIVRRAKNIGVWFKVLSVMMVVSMATNCFLIGFSSEQLAVWVPEMYETVADGDQWILPGYGRYVVGIVFGAEHFLILCVVLAHYLISDTPSHVQIELDRREYERKIMIEKIQHLGKDSSKGNL